MPAVLNDGTKSVTDLKEISNLLSAFFHDVIQVIKDKAFSTRDCVWGNATEVLEGTDCRFQFNLVTNTEIETYLRWPKRKKSTGLDKISLFVLKDCSRVIALPLSHLINLSFTTGVWWPRTANMKKVNLTKWFLKSISLLNTFRFYLLFFKLKTFHLKIKIYPLKIIIVSCPALPIVYQNPLPFLVPSLFRYFSLFNMAAKLPKLNQCKIWVDIKDGILTPHYKTTETGNFMFRWARLSTIQVESSKSRQTSSSFWYSVHWRKCGSGSG